ncbi:MAG: DUF1538 domain-containing protein [Clostridia bacterium]|nr:DUF1538 domain-containing protein [Clostridia bacterium]
MEGGAILSFLVGCILVIGGMSLFAIGADAAMIPIGELVGSATTKTRNLTVVIVVSILIGAIITMAEPDLSVLASGLEAHINKWVLIALVAVGVGIFLALSMLRVIFGVSLRLLLLISYGAVFALALVLTLLGKEPFLPLAFDSGGVTTGPMTVPFIIAMGLGVANISGKSGADSGFGFVALASVGPIISVMLLGFFIDVTKIVPSSEVIEGGYFRVFGLTFLDQMKDVAISIGPIAAFFLIFRFTANRNMPIRTFWRIVFGLLYTYFGLVIFMTGAHAGFSEAGRAIGLALGAKYPYALLPLGVLIGFMIVAAEPAVHVLNEQVEKISGGTIKKHRVMLTMMFGVAMSVGLSMLRVLYRFSIWWLLLPGYALAAVFAIFTPRTYTAIAFDSGGVASGPMTATFLLPLATGACVALNGEEGILRFAYGLVAMVAMTPLIVLQVLGSLSALRAKMAERMLKKVPAPPAETPVVPAPSAEIPAAAAEAAASADEIEVIDL